MEDKDKIKFAIRYLKLGLKSKRTPPLYEELMRELGFERKDKAIQGLESVLENVVSNKKQLTKAKDILQRLLASQPTPSSMYEEADLVSWREINKEAEQFLKEVSE